MSNGDFTDDWADSEGVEYSVKAIGDTLLIGEMEAAADGIEMSCVSICEVATAVRMRNALDKWIRQRQGINVDTVISDFIVNQQVEDLTGL
jgi:hypothetical protein